jgi:hypothetical protein
MINLDAYSAIKEALFQRLIVCDIMTSRLVVDNSHLQTLVHRLVKVRHILMHFKSELSLFTYTVAKWRLALENEGEENC